MKVPALPTPEIADVKRLDHLPLGGAMLRELAVKDTLDALIPAYDRCRWQSKPSVESAQRPLYAFLNSL